jgi:hypothetical protein
MMNYTTKVNQRIMKNHLFLSVIIVQKLLQNYRMLMIVENHLLKTNWISFVKIILIAMFLVIYDDLLLILVSIIAFLPCIGCYL